MAVQQTSLFAWHDVRRELGDRQQKVLEVIQDFPGCDNHFISQKLGWAINSVTPRVHELRASGHVRSAGTSRNAFTGRLTMRWESL